MRRKGFKPDEITMLGVLSACNHGGLVEEGKRWFSKMEEFGLTPKIEHYGCLVDLLGRAGCLEEAERAEKVVKKAITLEPGNDGNYIMLRNLYAAERRWRDVEQIKSLMLTKGAKKEVGCSAIEVNSQVLEFVAGDNLHPHLKALHLVLDQLRMHMKVKDSLPNVDCKAGEA
ncbi:UNVERIFIED_CONTAM: Pentatricopeptide repeat-containing protein [Sesamum radiatum]|uniref:Pentatricopeptide repeat-containing protein n=1 Tax=Sesamum radiatum TaxID=300843 RepID=A0AAW2KRC2_SESRA